MTEEILFRATVLPATCNLLNSSFGGIITASFMFSIMHWMAFGANLASFLSSFLFSVLVSYLTLYYRTAWVAGVAHATYNLVFLYFLIGLPV